MKKESFLLAISFFCQVFFNSSIWGRLGGASLFAQLPDTDIYTAEVKNNNGKLSFSNLSNITNRKGYDNQPCFTPDGKSLLYVVAEDTLQSDIYSYDFVSKKSKQVTVTPESEYSPTLSPDGKNISVVRVDKDDGQRFYNYPLNDLAHPNVIKGTDRIGYYCWLNDQMLAMFILGDVMSLQVLNTTTSEKTWIASDIGRCMKLSPDKKSMYFVLKQNPDEWAIFELNISSLKMSKVISTLKGSEDFAVLPDGSMLMGKDGKLFQYSPAKSKGWEQVGDFTAELKDFYRISVSPNGDRIALVAFTGKKP